MPLPNASLPANVTNGWTKARLTKHTKKRCLAMMVAVGGNTTNQRECRSSDLPMKGAQSICGVGWLDDNKRGKATPPPKHKGVGRLNGLGQGCRQGHLLAGEIGSAGMNWTWRKRPEEDAKRLPRRATGVYYVANAGCSNG